MKHLDLRRSLRLTVNEGREVLAALDAASMPAKNLRAKLCRAIELATHTCSAKRGGRCSVCNEYPEMRRRVKERRASDFKQALRRGEELHRKIKLASKEDAMRNPPALKFIGGTP